MALDASRLAADIVSRVNARLDPTAVITDTGYFEDLAAAIVAEIVGFAVVGTTTSTPGAQAGGTTLPGSGSGGIT